MNEELQFEKKPAKKKIPGLPSTIVVGILLTISIVCLSIAFSINMPYMLTHFVQDNSENAGEVIAAVFVAILLAALLVLIIVVLLALPLASGVLGLIFSIKNIKRKETKKAINILGIVFTSISAVLLVAVITRLILLFASVM